MARHRIAGSDLPHGNGLELSACRRDDPAGDPRASAAERRGEIGVIVAAAVNHQRAALEIARAKARRDDGHGRGAGCADRQHGQVAQVPVAVGPLVAAGFVPVVVAARVTD